MLSLALYLRDHGQGMLAVNIQLMHESRGAARESCQKGNVIYMAACRRESDPGWKRGRVDLMVTLPIEILFQSFLAFAPFGTIISIILIHEDWEAQGVGTGKSKVQLLGKCK